MARRKKTEKRELSHEDIPRNTRATARRLLGRMARQWWKLLPVALVLRGGAAQLRLLHRHAPGGWNGHRPAGGRHPGL